MTDTEPAGGREDGPALRREGERALEILARLGARPAAPFHERGVAEAVEDTLRESRLAPWRDEFGNVLARYTSPNGGGGRRPIAFVAHMDHPGFELIEGSGRRYVARALGGVPAASLARRTAALAVLPGGERVGCELAPYHGPEREGAERLVAATLAEEVEAALPVAVVFDLPDFALDDGTIRMRALDDLAGCAGILAAVERLASEGADADVFAVFTRGEEGGLFGARLMAQAGTLPADAVVVSVESSPVIPGVAQGEGPVIRTGDAMSTFDGGAERTLIDARQRILERDPDFRCQRQLMSGGTCEGTAFALYGYAVTGVAFPLGNYHNATTDLRDPNGGVGAEYIALPDFLGGVDLMTEAMRASGDAPAARRLPDVGEDVRERMRATAREWRSRLRGNDDKARTAHKWYAYGRHAQPQSQRHNPHLQPRGNAATGGQ